MSPVPGAPTMARPADAPSQPAPSAANVPMIPFTRAARKKTRTIGQYGPFNVTAASGVNQLAPIQVPANGYLRALILDITGAAIGTNAAAVAFQNDGPLSCIQGLSFAAANGDSIQNQLDGFAQGMVNKYGGFSCTGANDPLADPTFTKITGGGATGGGFHYQIEVPCEFDARDGAGSFANMAANQSFNLNIWLNTLAAIFTTLPTNGITITIQVTAKYWAAPAAENQSGIPQATAPRCNNLVSLLQTQTPPVAPGTDQGIQLLNVGNVVRFIMFIARTAAGARTDADWPNIMQFLVNNDIFNFYTKNNWRRQMAIDYDLFGGITAFPTLNCLDTGVYVITDFMNDGSSGDEKVSGASNRDLMLVTGSGTALGVDMQNWGASVASLQIITNALRVPDTAAFYAPFGV